MKRVVIFGQSGALGRLSSSRFADRLAQQLGLELQVDWCLNEHKSGEEIGWIAVASSAKLSTALLHGVDTVIWLHFSPLAVAREWLASLRARIVDRLEQDDCVRLRQLSQSLLHLALAPTVYRALQDPALAHVSIHHLRTPEEVEFWLRAQAHRSSGFAASMQLA